MAEASLPDTPLVVVDTMIVVGSVIGKPGGADSRLLRLIETGEIRLASSDAWLRELSDVLTRPSTTRRVSEPGRAFRAGLTIGTAGALYRPERYTWPTLTDEKDWWMLDLIFECGADFIITRDKKVLGAAPKLGFKAVEPPEFLDLLDELRSR